jgi:hypothetical protein
MPSIGQTWVLASIGAVVEMGVLSTLNRLLMEYNYHIDIPGLGAQQMTCRERSILYVYHGLRWSVIAERGRRRRRKISVLLNKIRNDNFDNYKLSKTQFWSVQGLPLPDLTG